MPRRRLLFLTAAFSIAAAFFPLSSSVPRPRAAVSATRHLSAIDGDDDEYTVAILGDLHLDPRFMDDHIEGREHFLSILLDEDEDGNLKKRKNAVVVSLGDLGESKSVVEGSSELFAGTTACFELARDYLDGFEVIINSRSSITSILYW